MAERLKLEIVTPYGSVFDEEVEEVTAQGTEGEFGVLAGHAHFVTTLRIGMLTCKTGSDERYFFVGGGYAEVGPDRVVVMADSAEPSEDIDLERARDAMERAEERLRKEEEIDFARAQSALERATSRIHVGGMK